MPVPAFTKPVLLIDRENMNMNRVKGKRSYPYHKKKHTKELVTVNPNPKRIHLNFKSANDDSINKLEMNTVTQRTDFQNMANALGCVSFPLICQ